MRIPAPHMPANDHIESLHRPVSQPSDGRRQADIVALRVGAVQAAAIDRDIELAWNVFECRPQKGEGCRRGQLLGGDRFMLGKTGQRTAGHIAKVVHPRLLRTQANRL